MKKAVVTAAFGEKYARVAEVSIPAMHGYARAIGADFIRLESRAYDGRGTPHWEKLQLREVLREYERVLWLDADVLVRPGADDLFDLVPPESIGAWNEAPYGPWDYASFLARWEALSGLGQADYKGVHFNTGVLLLGRAHAEILADPPAFPNYELLWDQGWMNYAAALRSMPFFDIGWKWNHMFIAPGDRLDSAIVHYCGTVNGSGYAKEIPPGGDTADLLRLDLARWKLADLVVLARTAESLDETRPEWLRTFIEGTRENERYYRFLYELARKDRPAVMVETGTRLGCSAAQLAHGNPAGKMITVDVDPRAKARADLLSIPNLTAVLSDSLSALPGVQGLAPSIDLLYIDSDHTFDLASAEYRDYGSLVRHGGVVLFDDIHYNPEMERFWETVPEPKAAADFLHFRYGFGISVKP